MPVISLCQNQGHFHLFTKCYNFSKKLEMRKQTGVWLDYRNANIITLGPKEVEVITIDSDIETDFRGHMESSQPQFANAANVMESKKLHRREHQEKAYFNELKSQLNESDEIIILGPGEAKLKFEHFLLNPSEHTKFIPLNVETTDYLTMNQKIAKVKELFDAMG